jgi:hypothetical protein
MKQQLGVQQVAGVSCGTEASALRLLLLAAQGKPQLLLLLLLV